MPKPSSRTVTALAHAQAPSLPVATLPVLDEMKAESPKVIAISTIQNLAYRQELLSWAAAQYDRFPLEFAHNSV